MTKQGKIKDGLATVLFMVLVTFVCISAVSGLQLTTRERVALNESLFMKRAVMEAVNQEVPSSAADVDAWFAEHVRAMPDLKDPAYFEITLSGGGQKTLYAFKRSGKGLWGTITAIIGIRDDAKTIAGVAFLSHNETPGLGARISEKWFTDQLVGKQAPIRLIPEKTPASDSHEIDAITGATITSTAVRNMLNEAVAAADRTVRGAGQANE